MVDNNVKISVIMPVFNVEKYLCRAIDSVLNQTLTDFELFLIDDGSPDNCGKICDEYKNKDSRVKVIHKSNEGAHIARNTAIDLATGEYTCFFDSDDFIDKSMLNDMYILAKENDLDLLVSGFYIDTYVKKNKYITFDYIPIDDSIYHDKYIFRKNAFKYFDNNMFYSPWNKIYKTSYIKNNKIYFPITYRDDFPFVVSIIKDIENIGFTKKQYYHFNRERINSETSKFVANLYDKREEEHRLMLDLYSYWQLNNDFESMEMISRRYIDRVFECIVNNENKKSNFNKNQKLNKIKEYIENENISNSFKYANPKTIHLKIIYSLIKNKHYYLIYILAIFVNFIKNNFIGLFSFLKIKR